MQCAASKTNSTALSSIMSRASTTRTPTNYPRSHRGEPPSPPNIFARDIVKPSAEFKDPTEPGLSSTGSPGGNPPVDGVEPMDIDFETASADEAEAMEVDEAPTSRDWCVQYLDWIIRGVLPSNRAQARLLARRAKSFVVIDDVLYKRNPSGVMQ